MSTISKQLFDSEQTVSSSSVPVYTSYTRGDAVTVSAWVKNTGSQALSSFAIEFQCHPDADWVTVKSGSYTTASDFVPLCTGALETLAGGADEVIVFKLYNVFSWRVLAGVAASSTTVRMRGVVTFAPADIQMPDRNMKFGSVVY